MFEHKQYQNRMIQHFKAFNKYISLKRSFSFILNLPFSEFFIKGTLPI